MIDLKTQGLKMASKFKNTNTRDVTNQYWIQLVWLQRTDSRIILQQLLRHSI